MDGEEINGGPLELDYNPPAVNSTTQNQSRDMTRDHTHHHMTSPLRHDQQQHKNRNRFKSGNSQASSNGSFNHTFQQNGGQHQNVTGFNTNNPPYDSNISASIQSVTL